MDLLKKVTLKNLLKTDKGHLWMREESWDEFDSVVTEMTKDIIHIIQTQKKKVKITPQDVRGAYNRHKEKHIIKDVNLILKRIENTITGVIERVRGDINAEFREEQTKLLDSF